MVLFILYLYQGLVLLQKLGFLQSCSMLTYHKPAQCYFKGIKHRKFGFLYPTHGSKTVLVMDTLALKNRITHGPGKKMLNIRLGTLSFVLISTKWGTRKNIPSEHCS